MNAKQTCVCAGKVHLGYLFLKLLKHNIHSFAKQLHRLGLHE